jgi:hypothetical protein
MTVLGPFLSVPVGFAVYTIIWIIALMILSEVAWKFMEHLPEDDEDWEDDNHFVIGEG